MLPSMEGVIWGTLGGPVVGTDILETPEEDDGAGGGGGEDSGVMTGGPAEETEEYLL